MYFRQTNINSKKQMAGLIPDKIVSFPINN